MRKGCRPMEGENLPEVRLECLDEEAAEEVMEHVRGGPEARRGNSRRGREGAPTGSRSTNKMWPYDLADMAGELGLAGDAESAGGVACPLTNTLTRVAAGARTSHAGT